MTACRHTCACVAFICKRSSNAAFTRLLMTDEWWTQLRNNFIASTSKWANYDHSSNKRDQRVLLNFMWLCAITSIPSRPQLGALSFHQRCSDGYWLNHFIHCLAPFKGKQYSLGGLEAKGSGFKPSTYTLQDHLFQSQNSASLPATT